ncbi:MAG: hypothetical protein GX230_00870 [Lentisphaerae bacterium]|jgi:hypothetical protein|nr:hypothetical protein [Lentisphaerota bacterium]
MIKIAVYTIFLIGGFVATSNAKPMDTRAAENIPELRRIVENVRKGGSLSQKDRNFLIQCLDSRDPVLLSASAWIVGEERRPDELLIGKLNAIQKTKLDDMTIAFVRIAFEKVEAKAHGQRWLPSKESRNSTNLYLMIEATRALLQENGMGDQTALKKKRLDEMLFINAVSEHLSSNGVTNSNVTQIILFDERYKLLLSILQEYY